MKLSKTKINGPKIIKSKIFKDKRGYLRETFRNYFLKNEKFPFDVMSFSKRNVLRGLHIQTKKSQSKNTSGTTTRYNLEASVKFDITTENSTSTINITKDFVMKNLSDEFEEKIYENKIKDDLSESIINELLLYLPRVK